MAVSAIPNISWVSPPKNMVEVYVKLTACLITRSRHKDECNRRASELRDEALFKDPPPKEDCPICFLPMPLKLMCCASLPDATITSVPIYDFAIANEEVAKLDLEEYFPCCGKSSCGGCVHSFRKSENIFTCPFCKSERGNKTDEEQVEEVLKRVEANDPASIFLLANIYYRGEGGLQQDQVKAMELFTKSAELGFSKAHYLLGHEYYQRGDLKKTNFHYEAAAIAGHELACRWNHGRRV